LVAQSEVAETRCPGTNIRVFAPDNASEARTCAAVLRGIEQLAPCGLAISEPVRLIHSPGPILNDPDCMGALHCDEGRIEMLHPSVLSARLRKALPLSDLDDAALVDFILLHELVHAAVTQMDTGSRVSQLEDEDIAQAISFDALPRAARDKLVSLRGFDRPVRKVELTEDFLWMDPIGFGILAWLHFSTPGNGCAFIARLMNGSSDLFDRRMFDHP